MEFISFAALRHVEVWLHFDESFLEDGVYKSKKWLAENKISTLYFLSNSLAKIIFSLL